MSELTRQEIEKWRQHFIAEFVTPYDGDDGQADLAASNAFDVNALCDLALSALTARSEGFREGVEAAKRVCEEYGASCIKNAAQPGLGADIQDMWRDMNLAATRIAERIAALRREPEITGTYACPHCGRDYPHDSAAHFSDYWESRKELADWLYRHQRPFHSTADAQKFIDYILAWYRGEDMKDVIGAQITRLRVAQREPATEAVLDALENLVSLLLQTMEPIGPMRDRKDYPPELQTAINALKVKAASPERTAAGKPCPFCGRTDPHSHTAGPLGMS